MLKSHCLPLTVWGLGGAPETPEQGSKKRTGDRHREEETKIRGGGGGAGRPSTTWQARRGPDHSLQGMNVRSSGATELGSSHRPPLPCQSSCPRLRIKVRCPGHQMCDSAAITQPGKRYPQATPSLIQAGREAAEKVPALQN